MRVTLYIAHLKFALRICCQTQTLPTHIYRGAKPRRGDLRALLLLGLLVSGVVRAQSESQAYLTCGAVACPAPYENPFVYGAGDGINNLNVGGDYFDVTFTITAFGPAGALSSQYYGATTLYDGVGTYGGTTDSLVPAGTVISQNASNFYSQVSEVGNVGGVFVGSNDRPIEYSYIQLLYTNWTAVAAPEGITAPEIDPNLAGSGLALLVGGLLVLRGRRVQLLAD